MTLHAVDDSARVQRLKRAIAAGTYHVPAERVADAILAFFAR